MLVTKKYKYSYFEIKNIFEYLNKLVTLEGVSNESSQMILKNLKIIEDKYKEVMNGIYDPNKDPEIMKYNQEFKDLTIKFADRTEDGQIIGEIASDGKTQQPKITEKLEDFQKAVVELQTKYNSQLEMARNANDYNAKFMNNTVDLEITTWDKLEEFPDKLPPFVMFYFARDLI